MIPRTPIQFHLIILLNLQLCTIIKGNFNLEIIQNVDGNTKKVVSSFVELPLGSNVTLICKIINAKHEGRLNAHINWFKIPQSLNETTFYKMNIKKTSDLEFKRLSAQNEGHYACVSLKYGILKGVYVHVINDSRDSGSKLIISDIFRLKRLQRDIEIDNATDLDYVYNNHDLTDLQSFLENEQRLLDEYYKELENDLNTWEKYHRNNNYDLSYDLNQSNRNESTSSPLKPVFLLIGVLLLIIFVSIIIRCYGANKDNSCNSTENQTHNRHQHTNNNRIRCGHSGCCRNHLLNPSGICRFNTNRAPAEENRLSTRNDVIQPVDGDLPPNYTASVNNNEIAPPSYEEAIAIRK